MSRPMKGSCARMTYGDNTKRSLETLESPLLRSAGFLHGFSLRMASQVAGSEIVAALGERIGFDQRNFRQANQVHGRDVVFADEVASPQERPAADGLIARSRAMTV